MILSGVSKINPSPFGRSSPLFNAPDLSNQGVFKIFNPGKP